MRTSLMKWVPVQRIEKEKPKKYSDFRNSGGALGRNLPSMVGVFFPEWHRQKPTGDSRPGATVVGSFGEMNDCSKGILSLIESIRLEGLKRDSNLQKRKKNQSSSRTLLQTVGYLTTRGQKPITTVGLDIPDEARSSFSSGSVIFIGKWVGSTQFQPNCSNFPKFFALFP
ncbi:hypothetical protein M9H77_07007 [Catharanthus roseus]|uniref:Uncharacterized protein n=1 Tax=Catharanthus roseus TaxID=4058 RepID=A0ACC0BTP5_CATRO|nr:hypothetical protein M9H77_07007 [Catharanthus roseus]